MEELRIELEKLIKTSALDIKTVNTILSEKSLFPFSKETSLLAYFLSAGKISYAEYSLMKNEYRERNKYLHLFEMSPRIYGQTWGEQHICSLFPEFIKATKENIGSFCPDFGGEFDLWFDGIRIEVKACRASKPKTEGSLTQRAYSRAQAKKAEFKYHFQQLKPSCCDIFIFIGTCRDELIYWILTSEELLKTQKMSSQHRGENKKNAETKVFEGQIFMTEEELFPFFVEESGILNAVRGKAKH